MPEYEIHVMRGFFGHIYGYKVLTYYDVPGADHKVLIGTRQFEGKDAAEAYITEMQQRDQRGENHISIF